jgi:hypothetical protein
MATLPSGKIRVWRDEPRRFLSAAYKPAPLREHTPEPRPSVLPGAVRARERVRIAADRAAKALIRGASVFSPADLESALHAEGLAAAADDWRMMQEQERRERGL